MTKTKPTLEELEVELESAREVVRTAEKKRAVIYRKYEAALTKKFEESDKLDVPALVEHPHWNTSAHKKMNEYVRSLGLHDYCYFGTDSNPYGLVGPSFTLAKDENPTKTIWAIRRFYKTFKGFCEDENGEVFIDFMENTLSEHGSYSVYWKPADDSTRLSKITYGSRKDVFTGPLREVMKYIAKHHWYGEPYSKREEEPGW